jgi:hypothetical protein
MLISQARIIQLLEGLGYGGNGPLAALQASVLPHYSTVDEFKLADLKMTNADKEILVHILN